MEIKRVGSQPSTKGPPTGSLALCGSIRFFKLQIRHSCKVRALRLSQVRGPHGTPIPLVKLSSLRRDAAGRSARADRRGDTAR